MMLKYIFPFLAGISIVLQGTLNRQVASQIGLVSAVFFNALVFLVFSGALWLLVRYEMIPGASITSAQSLTGLSWWHVLPGIFGFLIVFSTPLAIGFFGAHWTFALIICTQLIVSAAWDSFFNRQIPSLSSFLGIGVMLLGLLILTLGRK